MKRTFYVKAIWDDEARVWYSETDIQGLFVETSTLAEFEEVMPELARDMIIANHITENDMATKSIDQLISTVTWTRPAGLSDAA